MFYVPIGGIPDATLAFLGYQLISEDTEFRMYRDYTGCEYVVQKANPYLMVHDVNDAQALHAAANNGNGFVIGVTP